MPGIRSFIVCLLVAYALSPKHYRSGIEPALQELETLLTANDPNSGRLAISILNDTPLLERRLFEERSGRSYFLLSRLKELNWQPAAHRYNSRMSYSRASFDAGYQPQQTRSTGQH